MDSNPSSTTVVLEDTERRGRAKERLYVICQAGGWGFLLVMQLWLSVYFGRKEKQVDLPQMASTLVMVMAMGLLLSHFARSFMSRWGWKQLGWRPLVPRVVGIAIVLSVAWSVLGYGYSYGVLRLPWTSEKAASLAVVALSCVQGTFLYVGWMCLYFFYHLFDRFNRSEIERLRLATHVKEAELRALKSQVNPHFIFNSLNSLRALIDENPARARGAVTQLANLLRYSLQSGQLETVPFEDELRVVNDYLALEQVRHEERLRVRMDIAPDTLALPIPPMLLQTLVENAVKYGISARPEGGEIAIIARRESGALRLQVTNPGELATDAARRRQSSTGVGLRNAADRLRLLFGERATLQLREDSPELVVAEAVVPLENLSGQSMKALLIDDERLARNELRRLLAAFPELEIAGEAANAKQAREQLDALAPDLIFLDVQMPGESGMELLESLEAPVPDVIFTTAYDEFAVKAFELNALDYLLKPVDPARLAAAIEKLRAKHSGTPTPAEAPASRAARERLAAEDKVFMREGDRCWFVEVKSIRLLESEGNYTRVHFDTAQPQLFRSLNAMEERLDTKYFFRANRRQIINLAWIDKIEPWFSGGLLVHLKGGAKVELSRRQAQEFRERMSL